jgi:hypothetical protein
MWATERHVRAARLTDLGDLNPFPATEDLAAATADLRTYQTKLYRDRHIQCFVRMEWHENHREYRFHAALRRPSAWGFRGVSSKLGAKPNLITLMRFSTAIERLTL